MDHSKFALTLDDGDLGETVAGGSFARRSVRVCGAQCVARRLDDLAARGELGEEDWRELLSRLDSACQLLSSLRHPNLVLFVGVHGEGTRDVAIVTERLFIDLERFISCYSSGAKLSLKLHILCDVSSALRYLHSAGVAHNSLQASSIMLTQDLHAKLADVEVSRIVDGTPTDPLKDYMPPESLSDPPVMGPEADCFSFGHMSLYLINDIYPQLHPPSEGDDTSLSLQVERRRQWIDLVGTDHCLHALILDCLTDQPIARPRMETINLRLGQLCQEHPRNLTDAMSVLQPSGTARSLDGRSSRNSTAALEQYRREVESIHHVTGYLLSLHGEEKLSEVTLQDSELRILRAENENLKKQAEKNHGYISFLEGRSPSSPHPPSTGGSVTRSNAGMMSARAFLVSRTASFSASTNSKMEPALRTKLTARRSLIVESEAEQQTSPDQQVNAVSDSKDTEVLHPESGANSELAKKLAKRRSFIF